MGILPVKLLAEVLQKKFHHRSIAIVHGQTYPNMPMLVDGGDQRLVRGRHQVRDKTPVTANEKPIPCGICNFSSRPHTVLDHMRSENHYRKVLQKHAEIGGEPEKDMTYCGVCGYLVDDGDPLKAHI